MVPSDDFRGEHKASESQPIHEKSAKIQLCASFQNWELYGSVVSQRG